MSGLIKGALGYVISSGPPQDTSQSDRASPTEPPEDNSKNEANTHQQGYLKKAVSGIYSVGSSTVGVGVSGVKWIAGSTYAVGTGVAGAVGSVAGSAAGAVGSGASVILSKVTPAKTSKEHND